MRYPGGKNGAGVYQTIINLFPRHAVYIEPFVGGGAIFERKRPASASILIDINPQVAQYWKEKAPTSTTVIQCDATSFLRHYPFTGHELVYCDPPYQLSTCSKKKIYDYEFTDRQHQALVKVLLTIKAPVILSGYKNKLYDEALVNWTRIDFKNHTRGGVRIDSLYLNYTPPTIPADLTYLGATFRDRERIKRKKMRWRNRLLNTAPDERAAIMEMLLEINQ